MFIICKFLHSANVCLNTKGLFHFFLNSDNEVSTSGLINFQGGIVELVTGFIMSGGKFESTMYF